MTEKTFFGLDQSGRPNLPSFHKIWSEDKEPQLYKGYCYLIGNNRFYFNDIAVTAEYYWESIAPHNFPNWLKPVTNELVK